VDQAEEIEKARGPLTRRTQTRTLALGDWRAARLPVGAVRGRKIGTGRRLADLAELASVSMCHLRGIRCRRRDVTPDTSRPALRRSSCLPA
jgi:hypothetical protein